MSSTAKQTDSQKEAFDSALSPADVQRLTTTGLGQLGLVVATVVFNESSSGTEVRHDSAPVAVLAGTSRVMIYLGDHNLRFSYQAYSIQEFRIRYGITSFSGGQVVVNAKALITDGSNDKNWVGNVEVLVACFG